MNEEFLLEDPDLELLSIIPLISGLWSNRRRYEFPQKSSRVFLVAQWQPRRRDSCDHRLSSRMTAANATYAVQEPSDCCKIQVIIESSWVTHRMLTRMLTPNILDAKTFALRLCVSALKN